MDATQMLTTETMIERERPRRLAISVELAAYLGLLLLAVVLRVAELDTVPLSEAEARQALAAWRFAWPSAAGGAIVPDSPLLFLGHTLSFTMLGGSELAARILTVLASLALLLSPVLFRKLLGPGRALAFSLLLTFSPVLLLASRSDRPVIWALLLAVGGLWALWQYWERRQAGYSLMTMVCLGGVLLLADPAGPVLALILAGAFGFALWQTRTDEEDREILVVVRERLAGWSWLFGVLAAALVVILVSTQFFAYPSGLSAVSGLLGTGLHGVAQAQPYTPAFFPLAITLFYEPVLVLIGIGGAVWLARSGWLTFVERFFLGWLILGVVASILYAGAGAEHALWLIVPLAGIVSRVLLELGRDPQKLLWYTPGWAKWVLALIMVALLLVLAVHTQALSRAFLQAPDAELSLSQIDARAAVRVLVAVLFIITGYFLSGILWGPGTAARGWTLGLLAFGLVTSLGSGWNAAVVNSDNPAELWHTQATSRQTFLLRQTLTELANRQTGGFPLVPLTVLAPEDGVVAWLVRDYPNAHFIQDLSDARSQGIVLLPEAVDSPDLGGNYVGERFTITQTWNVQAVRWLDFPAWWLQRRVRTPGTPLEVTILWLRQDIYNGIPYDPLQD